MEDALPVTDVLYMTRIQQERFTSPEEYNKVSAITLHWLHSTALSTDERLLHLDTQAADTGQVPYDHYASVAPSERDKVSC